MIEMNPYAPPKADLTDPSSRSDGQFIPNGRSVTVGRSWTWFSDAWALFRRQPLMMVVAGVAYLMIAYVLPQAIPVVGAVASVLLMPILQAGIFAGCRAVDQGSRLEVRHLVSGFREHTGTLLRSGILAVALLIVAFIPGMVVVFAILASGAADPEAISRIENWEAALVMLQGVGAFVAIGVLLTAALILPVVMAAWFAPILIACHGIGARASMKASFLACLKNFIPYFLYGLIVLVFGLLALVPAGLGLLVLTPVLMASVYTAYRDVFFTA